MPDQQPNDAPDTVRPRDPDTAAVQLGDSALATQPGGGGLGPRAGNAGDGVSVDAHGTAPNSPLDTGLSGEDAAAEARVRSTQP